MELENERKEWYNNTITGNGGHCPCCDRWGKVNATYINKTMARALHWLLITPHRDAQGWVNVRQDAPRWVLRAGGLTTLKYWGLVQGRPKEKGTQSSGIVCATPKAFNFVFRGTDVPKVAYVYNDSVVKYSPEYINFQTALESAFDFKEIMDHQMIPAHEYSYWGEE